MAIKVKTVTTEVEVTESLACDECGANIPLVFSDANRIPGKTEQGVHALQVNFDGGYGMFIDPIGEPPAHFLLCQDCAEDLCKSLECFGKYLSAGSQDHDR